jgi:hypothetical protein
LLTTNDLERSLPCRGARLRESLTDRAGNSADFAANRSLTMAQSSIRECRAHRSPGRRETARQAWRRILLLLY